MIKYKEIIYRYQNPYHPRDVMYRFFNDVCKIEDQNGAEYIYFENGSREFVAKDYIGRQVVNV